jgi:hypothetical protein
VLSFAPGRVETHGKADEGCSGGGDSRGPISLTDYGDRSSPTSIQTPYLTSFAKQSRFIGLRGREGCKEKMHPQISQMDTDEERSEKARQRLLPRFLLVFICVHL